MIASIIIFLSFCLVLGIALKWSCQIAKPTCSNSKLMMAPQQGFRGYDQPGAKDGAYESASLVPMPVIILVNPYLDQNVGSVARTMLNFGLTELRIVDPRCDILSNNSRALASGAYNILENAQVFGSIEDCLQDLQRVMATTIRPRGMTQMVYSPSHAAEVAIPYRLPTVATTSTEAGGIVKDLPPLLDDVLKVGILFGRERSGLTNEEVALADSIITIPTFNRFGSLNLAQAVNIVGYELWKRQLDLEGSLAPAEWLQPKDGERMARKHELDHFLQRQEAALESRRYQPHDQLRAHCFRNIRSVYQRTLMTKQEVDTLQGVLSCLIRTQQPTD